MEIYCYEKSHKFSIHVQLFEILSPPPAQQQKSHTESTTLLKNEHKPIKKFPVFVSPAERWQRMLHVLCWDIC